MTDDELSRWIAEKLEPLSTLPNDDDCDMADMESFPTDCWLASWRLSQVTGFHVPSWQPRDMVNDPAMTVMLLIEMKKAGMSFTIESEPDYADAQDIKRHGVAINEYRDFEIRLLWGDSNCPHRKQYDPIDGHGFTSFSLIADSFGRLIAEAFAMANGLEGRKS